MDTLVLLVGVVLSRLRAVAEAVIGADVCPGDWAWATTVFGVLVGLVPVIGAVLVAKLRRGGGGTASGLVVPAIALISCGLLPWLAFEATGEFFTRVAAGRAVGLGREDRLSLAQESCLGISQRSYLGSTPVTTALSDERVRAALFIAPLVLFPLGVAVLVWAQGRLAMRRGPRWPSRFFWLPVLILAALTRHLPAGATAQLWTGMLISVLAGVVAVLMVPPPRRQPRPTASRVPGAPRIAEAARRFTVAPKVAAVLPPKIAAVVAAPNVAAAAPTAVAVAPLAAFAQRVDKLYTRARHWLDGAPARMNARLAAAPAQRPPQPSKASRVASPVPSVKVAPAPTPQAPAASAPAPVPAPSVPAQRLPVTLIGPPPGSVPADWARFELIRQLGAGGFGGVWLAFDHLLGHQVALKAAHAPDSDTEQRIRREASALGAARHPNCVRIFDLVDSRSDPGLHRLHGLVIVMAYVHGASLDDLVHRRGPMHDVVAARTWLALTDALRAAHRHGVLHRDVKPGNVLIDPSGQPHLIDFGIARARGDATLTVRGFVLGTPDYLAPEVARGEPASPASDGWQLAATMSFALTGRPPRGGHEDAISGLRAAASGAPPAYLPTSGPHCELLRACLADKPAERPALSEVHQALSQWLSGARSDRRPSDTASASQARAGGRSPTS